jgi:ADP-heptose:LPS heptosyltransferase
MAAALDATQVRRIAVFRALVLGDLLCATPALRALRHGFAQAQITLIGLPWAAGLVQRLPTVDRFIAFPGYPGLPEVPPDLAALPSFLAEVQGQRFDLALQLHGSGRIVNPLVASFGARHAAVFFHDGDHRPDLALATPWPEQGHEIERCLALTDGLGLPRRGLQLDLPPQAADDAAARTLWPRLDEPFVCMHPGAQLPSRRWPVQRFAAVADALAARGLAVLITGTAGEAPLAQALQAAMTAPAVNLVGRTDLWTLAALIGRARLLVANDTGVSHIAAARGTPSVIVSSGADVARWAPLDARRHRVLWQPAPCRPCGHAVCPTAHECATAVTADSVIAAALDQLDLPPPPCPTAACASSPGTFTATTCTT